MTAKKGKKIKLERKNVTSLELSYPWYPLGIIEFWGYVDKTPSFFGRFFRNWWLISKNQPGFDRKFSLVLVLPPVSAVCKAAAVMQISRAKSYATSIVIPPTKLEVKDVPVTMTLLAKFHIKGTQEFGSHIFIIVSTKCQTTSTAWKILDAIIEKKWSCFLHFSLV